MKHREWLGNKNLILELLKKANLDGEELGMQKKAMRNIILYKYLNFMTVDETLAVLAYKHEIYIGERTYYRLLNKALDLME